MSRARLGGGPVDGVLFDYGMTLVTFARPERALLDAYTRIAALVGARLGVEVPPAADLLTAVHDRVDAMVEAHQKQGGDEEIDIGAAHAAAWAGLGLPLPDDLLDEAQRLEQHAWFTGVRVADGAIDALATLRGAGLRVGLCSNAPYRAASMLEQLDHLDLRRHLDAVVFSSEAGWRKPSRRLFDAALSALGVPADRAVMVGDRVAEDVDGAHRAGMRAVLVRGLRSEPDPLRHADAVVDGLADLPRLLGVA